jgi:hypothetical protein
MGNFVGINELAAIENLGQHGIGGRRLPSPIASRYDKQLLYHFNLQKYKLFPM